MAQADAELAQAELADAELEAGLVGAVLEEAGLVGAVLEEAVLEEAELEEAELDEAGFDDSDEELVDILLEDPGEPIGDPAEDDLADDLIDGVIDGVEPELGQPLRPVPSPPERDRGRDRRLERAAGLCRDLIANGGLDGVDTMTIKFLGHGTWNWLTGSWSPHACELVARASRETLNAPETMHGAAAQLTDQLWALFGRSRAERFLARELARRFPILGEGQLQAAARAAQLAGFRLCLATGHSLTECPCFIDVVDEDGEMQPRQLLRKADNNWPALSRLA